MHVSLCGELLKSCCLVVFRLFSQKLINGRVQTEHRTVRAEDITCSVSRVTTWCSRCSPSVRSTTSTTPPSCCPSVSGGMLIETPLITKFVILRSVKEGPALGKLFEVLDGSMKCQIRVKYVVLKRNMPKCEGLFCCAGAACGLKSAVCVAYFGGIDSTLRVLSSQFDSWKKARKKRYCTVTPKT